MGSTPIGISATRASAILGLNEWKTPVLAWQELMEKIKPGFNAERGFILPEREDKAVFRWGHAFESAIIELSEQAQDSKIGFREKLCRDGNTPEAFCYIDGMYQCDGRTLHEGKTTFEMAFRKKWGEPGTDRIPQTYQIQVQHEMMSDTNPDGLADETIVSVLVFPKSPEEWEEMGWRVSGERCINDGYLIENENLKPYDQDGSYWATYPHHRRSPIDWAQSLADMGYFHQYHIKANRDTHKMLREMYEDFWNRYILTETPPEVTDYEDIRRLFPAPKGTLVVPESVASKMREYKDINSELGKGGHLSKRKEQLKTEILKWSMEQTTVADDESQEKVVFVDESGNKLGQFNGTTYR